VEQVPIPDDVPNDLLEVVFQKYTKETFQSPKKNLDFNLNSAKLEPVTRPLGDIDDLITRVAAEAEVNYSQEILPRGELHGEYMDELPALAEQLWTPPNSSPIESNIPLQVHGQDISDTSIDAKPLGFVTDLISFEDPLTEPNGQQTDKYSDILFPDSDDDRRVRDTNTSDEDYTESEVSFHQNTAVLDIILTLDTDGIYSNQTT
jgi:hypothetical protein